MGPLDTFNINYQIIFVSDRELYSYYTRQGNIIF